MDDRLLAKKRMFRIINHPASTRKQIQEAYIEFFKKYSIPEIKRLEKHKIKNVVDDILTTFDGTLFA